MKAIQVFIFGDSLWQTILFSPFLTHHAVVDVPHHISPCPEQFKYLLPDYPHHSPSNKNTSFHKQGPKFSVFPPCWQGLANNFNKKLKWDGVTCFVRHSIHVECLCIHFYRSQLHNSACVPHPQVMKNLLHSCCLVILGQLPTEVIVQAHFPSI